MNNRIQFGSRQNYENLMPEIIIRSLRDDNSVISTQKYNWTYGCSTYALKHCAYLRKEDVLLTMNFFKTKYFDFGK